jgi:hypothetical protein
MHPGLITLHQLADGPGIPYFVYRPRLLDPAARPIVAVHGISRNAEQYALAFAGVAERTGALLVAPLFRECCGGYQRLSAPALAALERILAELRASLGLRAPGIDLFGFSGGAQFAHRYALLWPQRVGGLAICSAGWYTSLHFERRFPQGLGPRRHDGALPDLPGFLEIPLLVLVGDRDVLRDCQVRNKDWINKEQGRTRFERTCCWATWVQHLAGTYDLPRRCKLRVLQGVGHSFDEAISLGGLPALVEEHFLAARSLRQLAPFAGHEASPAEAERL